MNSARSCSAPRRLKPTLQKVATYYHVLYMSEPDIVISSSELITFARQLLEAVKVPPPKAELVATSLVAANLRGVDSHGVQLLAFYVEQIEFGDLNPAAEGHIISENGGSLVFHGEDGLGQHVANVCSDHAIRLAKEHGIGMVISRESNHFGAAAYWAQKMAAAGQIGIVLCDASSIVPPWQGKQNRIGTNPICMAVPGPWLLDMATTTVAANKIFKAAFNNQPTIPAGWAMDADGVPTTDTQTALKGLIMPLGGYKGSGLAMMVEILCAVLSGGAMSTELGGIRIRGRKFRVNQTFLAIEIERFMPVAEFTARVEKLVGMMKSTAPAAGYDEVLVAGEPEWRTEKARSRDGIPIGAGTWQTLVKIGEKRGVPIPTF
jgi:LDH2 family malate/lactate/ureidoglycolate dehydrogenase